MLPNSPICLQSAINPIKKKSESRLLYYFLLVASLVAQLVKNPSEMWKTWIRSLGWEDPLEERTATHSNILAWDCIVHRVTESDTTE